MGAGCADLCQGKGSVSANSYHNKTRWPDIQQFLAKISKFVHAAAKKPPDFRYFLKLQKKSALAAMGP